MSLNILYSSNFQKSNQRKYFQIFGKLYSKMLRKNSVFVFQQFEWIIFGTLLTYDIAHIIT